MVLQTALAAAIFITMGPPEQAKALLTEALETADALSDLNAQAEALSTLISVYASRGEYGRPPAPCSTDCVRNAGPWREASATREALINRSVVDAVGSSIFDMMAS
jgi:hypothetical protein